MNLEGIGLKIGRTSRHLSTGDRGTRAVRVGSLEVGGERPCIIAGPCAVENRRQTLEIAC